MGIKMANLPLGSFGYRRVLQLVAAFVLASDAAALQPILVRDDNLKLPSAWKACENDSQCVRLANGCGETAVSAAHLAEARKQSYAIAGDPATLNCAGPLPEVWSAPMCLSGSCTLVKEPPLPPSMTAAHMSLQDARSFLARSSEYEACSVAGDCTLGSDQCGGPHAINRRYLAQFEAASRISGTAVSCVVPKPWSRTAGAGAVSCRAGRCEIPNPNVLYPECSTCGASSR
jgi:hypothetical protein